MLTRTRKFLSNNYTLLMLTILVILQLDDADAHVNNQCLTSYNPVNPFLDYDYESTTLAATYTIVSANVDLKLAKFFLFAFDEKNTGQLKFQLDFVSKLGSARYAPTMILFPSIAATQQLDCNSICITAKTLISYKIDSAPRRPQKNCALKGGTKINFSNSFICQGWDDIKLSKTLDDIRNVEKIRGVLSTLKPLYDDIGAVYGHFGIETVGKKLLSARDKTRLINLGVEIGNNITSLLKKIPTEYFTKEFLSKKRIELTNLTRHLQTQADTFQHVENLYHATRGLFSTLSSLYNSLSDSLPASNQTVVAQRDQHLGNTLRSLETHTGNIYAFFGKAFLMQNNQPRKAVLEQLDTLPYAIMTMR